MRFVIIFFCHLPWGEFFSREPKNWRVYEFQTSEGIFDLLLIDLCCAASLFLKNHRDSIFELVYDTQGITFTPDITIKNSLLLVQ